VEDSGSLASIVVKLTADASEFMEGLKKASDSAKAFVAVGASMAAAGGVMEAGLMAAAKHAADFGDMLRDASQRTGVTTQQLAGLRLAADESGASFEELTKGLGLLSKQAVAAAEGSASAQAKFDHLGISVRDASGAVKPMNQLLLEASDKFHNMHDGTEKSALAMEVFGKSGASLIPLLNEGSAGLAGYTDKATRFGTAMGVDATKAADAFNDSQRDVEEALSGLTITVGTELMPAITELMNEFTNGVVLVKDFAAAHPELIRLSAELAAGLIAVGTALTTVGGSILAAQYAVPMLTKGFGEVTSTFSAMVAPAGEAVSALGALGGISFGEIPAALSLIGESSVLASAGLVGVAAAVGISIGAFADWMIEGTRVQGWLDSFSGKVLAEYNGQMVRMLDTTAKAADVLEKKYGVNVERGTLSVEEWNAAVTTALRQHEALDPALQRSARAQAELTKATDDSTDALGDLVHAFEAERDVQKSIYSAVVDAAKAHGMLEPAVHKVSQSAADLRIDLSNLTTVMQDLTGATTEQLDVAIKLTNASRDMGPTLAGLAIEAKKAGDEFKRPLTDIGSDGSLVGLAMKPLPADAGIKQVPKAVLDAKKALDQATKDVKESAGHIFDDMFTKGESVFSSLQNALKGGALSIGRSIFEDVVGWFGGPIKKAFDDFFTGLLESSGIKKFVSGLGSTIGGALFGGGSSAAGPGTLIGGGTTWLGGSTAAAGSAAATAAAIASAAILNPISIALIVSSLLPARPIQNIGPDPTHVNYAYPGYDLAGNFIGDDPDYIAMQQALKDAAAGAKSAATGLMGFNTSAGLTSTAIEDARQRLIDMGMTTADFGDAIDALGYGFDAVVGKWQAGIVKAEQDAEKLRLALAGAVGVALDATTAVFSAGQKVAGQVAGTTITNGAQIAAAGFRVPTVYNPDDPSGTRSLTLSIPQNTAPGGNVIPGQTTPSGTPVQQPNTNVYSMDQAPERPLQIVLNIDGKEFARSQAVNMRELSQTEGIVFQEFR
jgi:hypothetical protein